MELTLLIAGVDPFAGLGQTSSLSCRLYPDVGQRVGAPTMQAVREAPAAAGHGWAGSAGRGGVGQHAEVTGTVLDQAAAQALGADIFGRLLDDGAWQRNHGPGAGWETSMPAMTRRDEPRRLTGQGAQLAEVLPAEDYDWAHLPGAVSLPLKELDARAGQLDRSRPVIVYCYDSLWDMSPRAAWRLEAAGFGPVYDYAAGKTDWLAHDLPFEGTARLAGMYTRRGVATVGERTPAAEALRLLDAQGFGPVLVVNPAGVVMGAAHRADLRAAPPQAGAGTVMRFGVSTVRPSEDAAALAHRMGHNELTRVVVTRPDGTPVGLFFAADASP